MRTLTQPADRARRALDRMAFGPRPGEVARVAELGPEPWLRAELARPTPPGGREISVPALQRARSREARREMREAGREVVAELAERRLVRAVRGEAPLHDAAFDFWANHFHVYARKGPAEPLLLPSYERDVLHPHALGRFEDLLLASARHPAMLLYLDNWRSAAPRDPRPSPSAKRRGFGGRPAGLNENYARELLELHTLGVGGGYDQRDVEEVARAFSGWTLDRRDGTARFRFRSRWHDDGEKHVLGLRIAPGGGVADGEEVIRALAHHPSTAQHLARKLARRFLADDPPEAAVARTARRFLETEGDLRATFEALLLDGPELQAVALRKLKTPFELVASALRASGAQLDDGRGALRTLRQLGQLPYLAPSPAGWPDRAERWLDPGSVLARTRFCFQLAEGRIPGVALPDPPPDPESLLAGPVATGTREVLANPSLADDERLALALASPEFQLR